MQLGLENKRKVIAASVLGVVAVMVLAYELISAFGGGGAPSTPAGPVATVPTAPATSRTGQVGTAGGSGTSGHAAQQLYGAAELDPTLHPERMALAETIQYTGSGRNIFSRNSAPVHIEAPIAPVRTAAPVQVATGPPPPPPIDLHFFGFTTAGGGKPKAFLLQGEDVFIASEGDVVGRRYQVNQISKNSVTITDIPVNNRQVIALTQN